MLFGVAQLILLWPSIIWFSFLWFSSSFVSILISLDLMYFYSYFVLWSLFISIRMISCSWSCWASILCFFLSNFICIIVRFPSFFFDFCLWFSSIWFCRIFFDFEFDCIRFHLLFFYTLIHFLLISILLFISCCWGFLFIYFIFLDLVCLFFLVSLSLFNAFFHPTYENVNIHFV